MCLLRKEKRWENRATSVSWRSACTFKNRKLPIHGRECNATSASLGSENLKEARSCTSHVSNLAKICGLQLPGLSNQPCCLGTSGNWSQRVAKVEHSYILLTDWEKEWNDPLLSGRRQSVWKSGRGGCPLGWQVWQPLHRLKSLWRARQRSPIHRCFSCLGVEKTEKWPGRGSPIFPSLEESAGKRPLG